MSILLICPPQKTVYGLPALPRLGLAYLSAGLSARDIDHDILDLSLYPKNWRKVLDTRLTRHSVFGITSTTFEFNAADEVARCIKGLIPGAQIILGGPHAILMSKEILKASPEYDYILKGEGENVLPEFVLNFSRQSGGDIMALPGLLRRDKQDVHVNTGAWITDLDVLPFPSYEKFELEKYIDSPTSLPILTSRGCPFSCIYCSVGLVMGRKFRARTPINILTEMEYMVGHYGTSMFSFCDDNLTFDGERAKELFRLLVASGLKIKWNASNGVRVNNLDEEMVSLMKDSGCTELAVGIESTSDNILRRLKKGTTREMVEKAVGLIRKYRIPLKGFFLIGSPDETRENVLDSLEFAKKNLDVARFSMLTPYPGTRLWQWVNENNYWISEDPVKEIIKYTHIGDGKTIYETPEFSKKDKERTYAEVYREWERFSRQSGLFNRMKSAIRSHPLIYEPSRYIYHRLKRIAATFVS